MGSSFLPQGALTLVACDFPLDLPDERASLGLTYFLLLSPKTKSPWVAEGLGLFGKKAFPGAEFLGVLPSLAKLLGGSFYTSRILVDSEGESVSSSRFFSNRRRAPSLSQVLVVSTCPVPFYPDSTTFSVTHIVRRSTTVVFPLGDALWHPRASVIKVGTSSDRFRLTLVHSKFQRSSSISVSSVEVGSKQGFLLQMPHNSYPTPVTQGRRPR